MLIQGPPFEKRGLGVWRRPSAFATGIRKAALQSTVLAGSAVVGDGGSVAPKGLCAGSLVPRVDVLRQWDL
jgi:hypothetical protein